MHVLIFSVITTYHLPYIILSKNRKLKQHIWQLHAAMTRSLNGILKKLHVSALSLLLWILSQWSLHNSWIFLFGLPLLRWYVFLSKYKYFFKYAYMFNMRYLISLMIQFAILFPKSFNLFQVKTQFNLKHERKHATVH